MTPRRRHPSAKMLLRKSKSIDVNLKDLQQEVQVLKDFVKQNEIENQLLEKLDEVKALLLERMPKSGSVKQPRDYIQ